MKYQKPEAEVKDFKALEENASQWVKSLTNEDLDSISAFKVEEGYGPRDEDFLK